MQSKYSMSYPLQISSVVLIFWLLVVVPALFILGFAQWQESGSFKGIAVPLERWQVLTDNVSCLHRGEPCGVSELEESQWGTSLKRGSPEYWNWIKEKKPQGYWLGLTITEKELLAVQDANANHLFLGFFYSGYELWIEGRLREDRVAYERESPIELILTPQELKSPQLRIAIRLKEIYHGLRVDYPGRWGASEFLNAAEAERLLRSYSFVGQTKPWMFFGLYFSFGLLFFFIWHADRSKREYWVATIFCFISSGLNLLSLDAIDRLIEIGSWYRLYTPLVLGEMVTVILLGLAFTRLSMSILVRAAIGTCAIALLVGLFLSDLTVAQYLLSYLQTFGLPIAWWVAAAVLVREHYRSIGNNDWQFLLLFMAFWSTLCGLTQATAAFHFDFPYIELAWSRMLNLFPLFHLLSLFGRSYRIQSQIVSTSPVSSFHKRTILPSEVRGYLLSIDLKRSELLFSQGAKQERGGTWVNIIISHLWNLASSQKATVLQSEGDSLAIFFPDELKIGSYQIVELLCAMDEVLERVTTQMRETVVDLSLEKPFHFRAAVTEGRVKPIWREVENQRYPAWIEAGSENVFVVNSRLLEAEKDFQGARDVSTLTLNKSTRNSLLESDQISEGWMTENLEVLGKHGKTYTISILSITHLRSQKTRLSHLTSLSLG